MENQIQYLNQKIDESQKEVNSLTEIRDNILNAYNSPLQSLIPLQEFRDSLERDKTNLLNDKSSLTQENASLKNERDNLSSDKQSLQDQVSSLNSENQILKDKVAELLSKLPKEGGLLEVNPVDPQPDEEINP